MQKLTSLSSKHARWRHLPRARGWLNVLGAVALVASAQPVSSAPVQLFFETFDDVDFGKIDNILVTGMVVPLPAPLALLVSGLFGLALLRRRAR